MSETARRTDSEGCPGAAEAEPMVDSAVPSTRATIHREPVAERGRAVDRFMDLTSPPEATKESPFSLYRQRPSPSSPGGRIFRLGSPRPSQEKRRFYIISHSCQ